MHVFFNAQNAAIVVSINSTVVATASNAQELAAVLAQHNVTDDAVIMCSSDVDFASEEGFDTDDCAHELIEDALMLLSIAQA